MSTLTTTFGMPVGDNQNSLTAGPRGPVLMQDFQLIEKLAHFNRERIPERVVHAKGAGAYGIFTVTSDITRYTEASVLRAGRQGDRVVPALLDRRRRERLGRHRTRPARLRREVLHRGRQLGSGRQQHAGLLRARSAQVPRLHPHARSATRGPTCKDADHAVGLLVAVARVAAPGDDPVLRSRHCRATTATWTASAATPSAWINADGERFWVKFHFKTKQGIENLTADEAARMAGIDRDHAHARPVRSDRSDGDFPRWTRLGADHAGGARPRPTSYDPFDLTKVWPHGDYPRIQVGELVLNRNPENYFAEVEQAAFEPGECRARHRRFARTRCCRAACSPMPTRIATASASITACCR